MDDLRKQYLELLGLEEDCTETEINTKYDYICMRARNDKSIDIDEATKAYNYLLNLNIEDPKPVKPIVEKYRKVWFKHIGTIAIILIIFATVLAVAIPMFTNKEPDLTISYVGPYTAKNTKDIENYLYEKMPNLKNILMETIYATAAGNDTRYKEDSYDASSVEKLSLLLVSGDLEIIVCDDAVYRYILSYNYLLELDDILMEYGIEVNQKNIVYGIKPSTGEKVIYGINVQDNNLLSERVYVNEEYPMILCISNESANLDNVKQAVRLLLTAE
ncbi:MAG TPA: hypothetical protein PLT91_05140 [Clostridia bacterium]|nr:MAG: hypothetical protein BWX97_01665 [Firmicutes bacterium ADurb.Bin146]HOD93348.1 hypothetical protein [Clostridia bacterium]HQM39604.1 hypothetical protein [Clostridia bacterium]